MELDKPSSSGSQLQLTLKSFNDRQENEMYDLAMTVQNKHIKC